MLVKAKQDLFAGLLVAVVGAVVSLHVATSYNIGTPAQMGPGFFPLCLSICMVVMGLLIAGFGARAAHVEMTIEGKPLVAILASIAAFALVLPLFGLLPATFLQVVICLASEQRPRILVILLTALGVSAVAFLVFRVGLQIALPALKWPM